MNARRFFLAESLLIATTTLSLTAQERDLREFLGLGRPPDKAAAKLGEPLYKQYCSGCHGEDARGGQAPNLLRSTVVLHDEKGEEVATVVKNGRPQAGMPAFPNLKEDQIYNIAEYLHLQVELAANRGLYNRIYANQRGRTSGDAAKGQTFFAANCASCHSANGDLAKVGSRFSEAAAMQPRFIWPASREPARATVTTPSGETVSGTLAKLNDFEVKLRDASGTVHEWPRDQVRLKVEDKLEGHRALLPKYTDTDLHDVTAYLLTLK